MKKVQDKEAIATMASILYHTSIKKWPFKLEELLKENEMNPEKCGTQQAREGQVSQELDRAEKAANSLITKIDMLVDQLSTVLQEATPTPPSNEKEIDAILVPLARRIRSHSILLQIQEHRLQEILNKLEIR
jgi:hypothetical protein